MRLMEFTNAEEQLGLLRRIIDSTWTAIADEAVEQKKQKELDRIAAANKPKAQASSPRRASPPANTPRKPRPPSNNKPATPSAKPTEIQRAYAQGQQAGAVVNAKNKQALAQQQAGMPAAPKVSPKSKNTATGTNSIQQALNVSQVMPQTASSQTSLRPYTAQALRKQRGV